MQPINGNPAPASARIALHLIWRKYRQLYIGWNKERIYFVAIFKLRTPNHKK